MILHTIADKIVFSILNKVVYGYIEITTFSGQILKFGNPDQKLKVTLKIKNPSLNFNLIKNRKFAHYPLLRLRQHPWGSRPSPKKC